ncbi:MAG TPA: phosphatase PAP2 family protein [Solirubrobacteraceae bacterium]|jgi:undecaprenyl-diphosphatase|nr:phosphatase PAP2 family protein [Solirubrobacteraceae bacterium]
MTLDEQILRAARTWGHTSARDRAVGRFSLLGEHAGVWLAIGVLGGALDPARRSRWGRATATVAATYALNTALKLLFRRRRPELDGLPPLTATPTRLSFPSAHASTAFAGAFAYTRLGLPAPPLYGLAAKLSLSRLYLGVHYPSDVLAGALLGTAVAVARGSGGDPASPSANGRAPGFAPGANGHGPLRPTQPAGERP